MQQQPAAAAGAKRAADGTLAEQPSSKSSKVAAEPAQEQQQQQAVVQLSHAVSSDKGTRVSMEDVHVAVHDAAAPRDASRCAVVCSPALQRSGKLSCADGPRARLRAAAACRSLPCWTATAAAAARSLWRSGCTRPCWMQAWQHARCVCVQMQGLLGNQRRMHLVSAAC